jgi:DNA-binding transcriptional LysR family regulator
VDTLKSLQVFQAVAAARSFAHAATSLGITAAMTTRYIKHIESHVGARLLNRSSRSVSLTEAGATYLARIRPLLEGLDEASMVVTDATVAPRGVLKIKMPAMMSTPLFSRLIAEFRKAYPEVKLHFDISWQSTGLVEDAYDLELHVGEVSAEGLIGRKLADVRSFLVATPSLLDDLGRPQSLDEIKNLPFLAHLRITRGNKIRWRNLAGFSEIQVNPVLRSGNEMMILHTALESVGATILPEWLVGPFVHQGRLETVLPDKVMPTLPLYALYPDRSYLPAKTRSFIDFMAEFKADDVKSYSVPVV